LQINTVPIPQICRGEWPFAPTAPLGYYFNALPLEAIMNPANAQASKPTIVLVHGAFAESDSWNGVLTKLITKGDPTPIQMLSPH